jgi:hypothetical protein
VTYNLAGPVVADDGRPNPSALRWRKLKANGVTNVAAEYRAVKAGTSKLSANLRRLVVGVYEND